MMWKDNVKLSHSSFLALENQYKWNTYLLFRFIFLKKFWNNKTKEIINLKYPQALE